MSWRDLKKRFIDVPPEMIVRRKRRNAGGYTPYNRVIRLPESRSKDLYGAHLWISCYKCHKTRVLSEGPCPECGYNPFIRPEPETPLHISHCPLCLHYLGRRLCNVQDTFAVIGEDDEREYTKRHPGTQMSRLVTVQPCKGFRMKG